MPKESRHDL